MHCSVTSWSEFSRANAGGGDQETRLNAVTDNANTTPASSS